MVPKWEITFKQNNCSFIFRDKEIYLTNTNDKIRIIPISGINCQEILDSLYQDDKIKILDFDNERIIIKIQENLISFTSRLSNNLSNKINF